MIQLRCGRCLALLQVPESAAGQQAKCPNCESVEAIPLPGQEARKQRCGHCGANFDFDYKGLCLSCGQGGLQPWCAMHQQPLAAGVCTACVARHNERFGTAGEMKSSPPPPVPSPTPAPAETTAASPPADEAVPRAGGPAPPPPPPLPPAQPSAPGVPDYYRSPQTDTTAPVLSPGGWGLPSSGAATGSMVCGILGLVLSCSSIICFCAPVSLILGVVAVGLGFQAQNEIRRGVVAPSEMTKVIVGWVCGGLALLVGITLFAVGLMGMVVNPRSGF